MHKLCIIIISYGLSLCGMVEQQVLHYGNLYSYKLYLRPTAHRLYGNTVKSKIMHHQNVHKLFRILAFSRRCTTWQMAKIVFPNDLSVVKTKEKEYRRLLVGRKDRGKHSSGILEIGLVKKHLKKYKQIIAEEYSLSLYGILYCLDILNFTTNEIDEMAATYAEVLPKIFGKWNYLKSIIGDDVYKIKILSKGLLLDNPTITSKSQNPMYELMSYIHTKYRRDFESISETKLADQISFWFYTYLLYENPGVIDKSKFRGILKLQKIFSEDIELQEWYSTFYFESQNYYKNRFKQIKNSGLF